jgi:hypothetical protein
MAAALATTRLFRPGVRDTTRSAMGWLYVVPDAGKGTTPDVVTAFTCAVHDGQSAAQENYHGGNQ